MSSNKSNKRNLEKSALLEIELSTRANKKARVPLPPLSLERTITLSQDLEHTSDTELDIETRKPLKPLNLAVEKKRSFLKNAQKLREALEKQNQEKVKKASLLSSWIVAKEEKKIATVEIVVGIVKKSGPNFARLFQMQHIGGEMVPGTFEWLAYKLEDLIEAHGTHREKGDYVEFFTPECVRVLGSRRYLDECCDIQ